MDESTTSDIKCQNTCKNVKATNGVMFVSGALYTILLIGLVLPYGQAGSTIQSATAPLKMFLFFFLVVSTVFTISSAVHAGSLQRVDTGKLQCTFYNDTGFFDPTKYEVTGGSDTDLGMGLILLWIGVSLSALVWFIILGLFIGTVPQLKTNLPYVSLNEFF